jgi:hypothetical protein
MPRGSGSRPPRKNTAWKSKRKAGVKSARKNEGQGRPKAAPPVTPDGRYIVVRGRLWRTSNPGLSEARRGTLVSELMDARRAVALARRSGDRLAEDAAHAAVNAAKIALGERGAPWWNDGAPDLNRHMVRTTPYADWYEQLSASEAKTCS